jgi:hypothetical protein
MNLTTTSERELAGLLPRDVMAYLRCQKVISKQKQSDQLNEAE